MDIRQQAIDILARHRKGPLGATTFNPDLWPATTDAIVEALQTRLPMDEDEILQRARRACAATVCITSARERYLSGQFDDYETVKSVVRALRDLDKPLVDPIDEKLRAVIQDALGMPANDKAMTIARAAYEMGRADVIR